MDLITVNAVREKVITLRNKNVLVANDVADFYGYDIRNFNTNIKNNKERFESKEDIYMFELSKQEKITLADAYQRFGKLKSNPHKVRAFTEYGVLMVATILKTDRAIKVSKLLVEGFIALREEVARQQSYSSLLVEQIKSITERLDLIELKVGGNTKTTNKNAGMIEMVSTLLNGLLEKEEQENKKPIGF